jgi:uncharacterized protein (TIGR02996 family)
MLVDVVSAEEAFLAAIEAAPADDAPRLVYADWLDEQGRHDQAEVIRAEHRYHMGKTDSYKPRTDVDTNWARRVFPKNGLILRGYRPDRKIYTIMMIREWVGVDLAEGKAIAESLPGQIGGFWPSPAIERLQGLFMEWGADTERGWVPDTRL